MCFGGGRSGRPDPRQLEAEQETNDLLGGEFRPGLDNFNDSVRRNAEKMGYAITTPDQNNPDTFTASKGVDTSGAPRAMRSLPVSSVFEVTPGKYTYKKNYVGSLGVGNLATGSPVPSKPSQYQVIR